MVRLVVESVALLSTVVLARLVSPDEYGHAVIALILNVFAQAVTFQALGTPLVQKSQITRRHIRTAATLSGGTGLCLSVLTALGVSTVAGGLLEARTASLLLLASPLFFVTGLGSVPLALLQRQLDFRTIGLIEVASMGCGVCSSLVLAFLGLGGASVVLGAVVTAAASTALLTRSAGVVVPGWHTGTARELLRFSTPTAVSGMVYAATRNVDYVMVGARLGAASLGLYWKAFQLGVDYQGKVSGVILRVAFPVYSRATDLRHVDSMRRRIVRTHSVVLFPLLSLLIATAPVAVPWLYGQAWQRAAEPAQILAVAGMAAVVMTGNGALLTALGRPGLLLVLNVAEFALYTTVVAICAPRGLVAVCSGVAVLRVAWVVGLQHLVWRRVLGASLRSLVGDELGPAVGSAAVMLAVVWPLIHGLSGHLPPAALLCLAAALGTSLYLTALRLLFAGAWSDLRLLLGRASLATRVAPGPRPSAAPASGA
jgi:O-antigen/teichoic acid export membrane protein